MDAECSVLSRLSLNILLRKGFTKDLLSAHCQTNGVATQNLFIYLFFWVSLILVGSVKWTLCEGTPPPPPPPPKKNLESECNPFLKFTLCVHMSVFYASSRKKT